MLIPVSARCRTLSVPEVVEPSGEPSCPPSTLLRSWAELWLLLAGPRKSDRENGLGRSMLLAPAVLGVTGLLPMALAANAVISATHSAVTLGEALNLAAVLLSTVLGTGGSGCLMAS